MDLSNPNEMGKHLTEFRRLLATEQGTEPDCPFCGTPRVRRSDYIRCNPCGVNWLDEERDLKDSKGRSYLNSNPASARSAARTAATVSKSAGKSEAAADA